jgi:hypothetical protein
MLLPLERSCSPCFAIPRVETRAGDGREFRTGLQALAGVPPAGTQLSSPPNLASCSGQASCRQGPIAPHQPMELLRPVTPVRRR